MNTKINKITTALAGLLLIVNAQADVATTKVNNVDALSNSVEKWPGNQRKQRRKLSTLIYVMIRYFAGETLGVIYGLYCRNQKTSFYKW